MDNHFHPLKYRYPTRASLAVWISLWKVAVLMEFNFTSSEVVRDHDPSPQSPSPFSLPPYPLSPTPFDACYAGYVGRCVWGVCVCVCVCVGGYLVNQWVWDKVKA